MRTREELKQQLRDTLARVAGRKLNDQRVDTEIFQAAWALSLVEPDLGALRQRTESLISAEHEHDEEVVQELEAKREENMQRAAERCCEAWARREVDSILEMEERRDRAAAVKTRSMPKMFRVVEDKMRGLEARVGVEQFKREAAERELEQVRDLCQKVFPMHHERYDDPIRRDTPAAKLHKFAWDSAPPKSRATLEEVRGWARDRDQSATAARNLNKFAKGEL